MYKFKFNLYQAIKALESTLHNNSNNTAATTTTDVDSKQQQQQQQQQLLLLEDFKSLETIFKKQESEYTSQDKIFILNELSTTLMKSQQHCQLISNIFRPLLIDLVSRYINTCNKRNKKNTTTTTDTKSKKDSKTTNNNNNNEIENISLIFSQLLPTTPQLLGIVIQYYQNQSNIKKINIFDQILLIKNIKNEKESRWLSLVQSTYRLLSFNRKVFSSLWNWTPLFSLLEIDSHKIRWYVIKSMSMVLNVPDHQIEAIKPYYNQYHHQIVLIEKDILNIESNQIFLNHQQQSTVSESETDMVVDSNSNIDDNNSNSNTNIYIQKEDLDNSIVDICGILLFKKFTTSSGGILSATAQQSNQQQKNDQQNQLVYTTTVSQNLNSLAIAVGLGKPILIEGVTGSGKTTMVEELSKVTGNHNIIRIHLGDQTDSKVLLGTYVTSDTPGEFKWQAGALTQAVSEGRWILIEDIDLAPIEVLSVLIPLLESRTLFIPGRGEVIEAANGFQLFATQTLFGTHSRDQNANILSHLWTRVVIEALNTTEMKHVLTTLFPKLNVLIGKFIETFNLLLRVISNGGGAVSSDASDEKFVIPSSRFISSRDLIKWIKRCNQRLSLSNVSQMVTSAMKEIVFIEALDCFCSMISKKPLRNRLTEVIGKVWELTPDRINYYIDLYKPAINITPSSVTTGRATLQSLEKSDAVVVQTKKHTRIQNASDNSQESGVTKHGVFAHTMNSLRLIEKISISIQFNEPILLVGETGTGKTSVVQYVADQLNQKLVVLNLNQQSDSSDLIGGFKPVEMRLLCLPLKMRFDALFKKTFSEASNSEFLEKIDQSFISKNWKSFISLLNKAIKLVETKVLKDTAAEEGSSTKKRSVRPEIREKWRKLANDIIKLGSQFEKSKNNFAFSFVEGSLINCIRKGHWVLLDEMNLATSETLESLSGLFDGGSLTLTEKGDVEPVERHPNFRVFACMNPPTDIGKKDLPPGIRNRFTEYFVDDLENKSDLCLVVKTILQDLIPHPPIDDIVEFYLKTKSESQNRMLDGSNQKPHFSLRTLSRALNYTKHVTKSFGFQRALFEGISMSFLTQLNRTSYPMMEQLIQTFIKKGDAKLYKQPLSKPNDPNKQYVQIEQFWIEVGDEKPVVPSHYILTESIKANLGNLSRILVSRKHPILLQGPTSSGKTSMVEYLALRTGHRFIRINNHEHTDLQEYLGQYISDDKGKLVFQEGILVEAVRKGYWVVLDELNLAPSEVLEALNRLLDDNRELFIPETQEVVKPHPHFMLFATQNPPGLYGGRKVLSRAFRNRFLELHVDDIPEHELEEILSKRCALPPSYCKKLVAIMRELQLNRQGSSQVFAGKHGYITFRDLFRWAERNPSSYDELAVAGYMLLAERLRKEDEKVIIKQVIEKHLKVKLDMEAIYACDNHPDFLKIIELLGDQELVNASHLDKIVWTRSMKRLFALVGRCLQYKEPILLVGETGCSKTTICQLYSILQAKKLSILNCHQHTETADFVGGLRPVRGRDQVLLKLYGMVKQFYQLSQPFVTAEDIDQSTLDQVPIKELVEKNVVTRWKAIVSQLDTENNTEHSELLQLTQQIDKSYSQYCSLFTWVDGPLVEAMKQGHFFLIDEISLAEDAVLERLNSVLEPSRLLVLAEKGGVEIEELRGHQDFRILATMNPGGDFGKKELSPAMRNRFTEIWVPAISNHNDLLQIVEERFKYAQLKGKGSMMLEFIEYLLTIQKNKRVISLRDILSWISFMNLCIEKKLLSANESYIHGACLVLLDGFGMGSNSSSESEGLKLREACLSKLLSQMAEEQERENLRVSLVSAATKIANTLVRDETKFGIHPFYINAAPSSNKSNLQFSMNAPTTFKNALRVLRGMQLPRAILVEGSPGVGKTSLITAIAKASGNNIVRINLSEQTDIMDLLGSDLPVEGGTGGQFEWRDGVFLEALKNGSWVLLDELNLASQTVLEGLNSCLDHRSEVYIPELGKTFACHPNFRVFACQNPLHQGGGRKGLPKSFLNRFTQVFIDQLDQNDLLFISESMYPLIPSATLEKMISFNHLMHKESMTEHKFARKGAPWEFNLRDTFRWCDLIVKDPKSISNPGRFIDVIYLQRMRTVQDREYVKNLYRRVFPDDTSIDFTANEKPTYSITPDYLQIGSSILPRQKSPVEQTAQQLDMANIEILQRLLNPLENLMKCIEMNWMSILIGQTSSSKTSAIRLLAQLTGNTLYEFSMNSSVDTTEILGGFEQIDLVRYQKKIISSSYELIKQISSNLLSKITDPSLQSQIVACISDLHQVWNIFKAKQSQLDTQEKTNKGPANEQTQVMVNPELLDILIKILAAIEKVLQQFGSHFDKEVIANIELQVTDTRAQIQRIASIEKESVTGCFEWIDGLLIKALEQGAWILIDNVNFCNPTVLDRLNPLLEQGGVLMLNERGMVDGQVKVITPHPNFRIFLTMDDRKGEISRAMRNRGIEIYLPEQSTFVSQDNLRLLTALGIPSDSISSSMIQFHNAVYTQFSSTIENPVSLSQLLYWGKLLLDQLQRGFPLQVAISNSMEQIYIRPRRHLNQRTLIQSIYKEYFNQSSITSIQDEIIKGMDVLGVYPHFVKGSDYVKSSTTATLIKNTEFMQHYHKLMLDDSSNNKNASYYDISTKYFIESSSLVSLADRIGFLTALKDANQDYTSTVYSMKKLFKHPVYTAFEAKVTQLFSMLNVCCSDSILIYQGYQWKNNESLFKLIQEKVDHYKAVDSDMDTTTNADDTNVESLWKSVVNSIVLLTYLMEQCIAAAKQEKILKAFEKSPPANIGTAKFLKQTPVFLVSFAYSKKMIARDTLSNDLISFIYRIFDSLDQQIDQWFVQLQQNSNTTDQVLKTLGSIIKLKNNFWNSLMNNCVFNIGEFIIRWKWICKEIRKLVGSDSVNMNTQVSILFENVNAIISSFDTNANNRLWKIGGHPIVMRSEELVTLDSEFLALVEKIQYNFNKTIQQQSPLTHSSYAIDQEWRKTLIEAFTTLYWANFQMSSTDQTPAQQIEEIVKNIEQVPTLLADKLKELVDKQQNKVKVLPQVDAPVTDDGQPIIQNLFYDPVSLKHHTTVALWPLIDHTLHQRESKVMLTLMQFLLVEHMDLKNGCMKESIEPLFVTLVGDLKYIVENYKSSSIPRSLYHLVFYQKLIWMIDNYLSAVASSEEPRQKIGIVELQSIVHSILYVYNNSLWNNAYNDLGYVGKQSLPQYKYNMVSNNDIAKTSSNPFDTIRFGYGPPRLFQNIQSIFSFYLTCDWDFVSIADVPGKVEQLEQVIQHLTSPANLNDNQESIKHQYLQMFWLLLNTVSSSYSKVYSQQDGDLSVSITAISQCLRDESKDYQQHISAIKNLITNSSDKNLNQMGTKLLVPAFDIMQSYFVDTSILTLRNQSRLGKLTLLVSCFRMIMYVPSHPIDPTQKYNVILEYSTETSQQLSDEIFIRREIERLTTGKVTNMVIAQLEQLLEETDHQISLQKKKVTPRPTPSQFDQLHRDASQFSHHFANIEKVLDLIRNFSFGEVDIADKDVQEYQMLYSTETMWQEKANHFIQSLEKKFYSRYRDVVGPIITSVYQMKQGLRYMADAYRQAIQSQDVLDAKQDIQKVLVSLTQFPTSSSNDMIFLDKSMLDSIKQMMRSNTRDNQDSANGGVKNIKVIALLLRSSLCQIYNQLTISNHLCVDTLTLIDTIFRVFVEEWRFQEEEKRKKEELENQAFKYKVQSHKMETKEEKDEKVFLSSFPSFYKDFQDLETNIIVEQDEGQDAKEGAGASEESTEPGIYDDMFFKSSINDQEILQLCQIHRDIFLHLDGIPRPSESASWKLCEKDRVELFQLFYSCSYLLMKVLNQRVDDIEFDHLSMGSHIMSASYLKDTLSVAPISHVAYSKLDEKFKFLKTASYLSKKADPSVQVTGINESTTVISQSKVYNIYTDANIPEIGIIRKPMQEFRDRVFELLAEFPDHPNLTLIVKLIDRLLTYPATDPLIKILTGLELLLRKSLEWESFAHKGVSIQSHLDILSRLITRWRKLEIESWPSIFQNQEKESEIKALKIWFILYDLINDDPDTELDANIEKNFKTLQEYLFLSTLGDFLTRLELLKTFHLQLEATIKLINSPEKISYKQKLSTIILNIYKYFLNFVPRFESKLAKEIKPIEDKAIEFIKLSRWEDNKLLTHYERLKNHIEKSHRNLAKITIKYKNVLNLPLHEIFSQMDNDMDIPNQVLVPGHVQQPKKKRGVKQQIQIGNKEIVTVGDWISYEGKNYLSNVDITAESNSACNRDIKSLFKLDQHDLNSNKLSKLYKKMQQVSKKDLLESDCFGVVREGIECLDSMGGEIIERIEYLSNENNEVKTSEKTLSLNLLYSKLKELGLSFNTNQYPKEQLVIAYLFNIATLPDRSALPAKSRDVVDSGAYLIEQSDAYYYRIVSRIHRLRTLALEHHADLSARDIQRSGGFMEHLLSIIIANRKQSSIVLKYWSYLTSLNKLFSLGGNTGSNDDDVTIFPHQSSLYQWIDKQRSLVNQLYHALEEISLLCSKTSSVVISNDLQVIQSSVNKMKMAIDQHQSQYRSLYMILDGQNPLLTTSSLSFLLNIFEQINSVKDRINTLLDQSSLQSLNYLKNPLTQLSNTINTVQAEWNQHKSSLVSEHQVEDTSDSNINNVDQFMTLFDKIIKHLLVSIQDLKETANSIVRINVVEKEEQEQPEQLNEGDEINEQPLVDESTVTREYDIQDGHIYKLDQLLQKQMKSLDLKGLLMTLIELHLFIVDTSNQTSAASLKQYGVMLRQLQPLLNQYMLLVNQCILDQVSFEKTLSKLEYIILSVFIQLYQKGFCKSDKDDEGEASGDSNGKFEDDVEGTGMGEGKGKKDVSDEIEDQEQLMGTNTDEKDENDEDDDEDKEDKDEDEGFDMTEDFEGDMHDIKKDPKKDDEKDNKDEDEHDKEMGDLEQPEDKVVDEKLWNDEEDIKEDDIQDEEGEGAENTDEMVAKDDNEKNDKKQDKKDEKKKDKEGEKQEEQEKDKDGEEEGDEEEGDEEQSMEEYGEDQDDNDVINEEQEKEENHMDAREDEQFEIPDDLQLEQSSDEEGENPDPLDNDPNELPDTKMDQDDDQDEGDEGEEDEEKDGDDDGDNDKEPEEEEDQDNNDKDQNEQLDPSKIDHVNPEGEEEEPEQEEKDDNTALTANEQQDENPPDSEQPLGVKDKTGSKSNISNTDEEMKEENEDSNADDDNGMTLPTASDNDTGALKNLKSQPQQPQQPQQQQKKPQQVDPNPYRSMGDAQKEWKKRLNLLQEKEEEEVDSTEKAPKQDDKNKDEPENENQNYEFNKEDQDNKDEESEQALAAATESQLQDMPKSAEDDQDQDMQDVDDNDDQMDLDNNDQEQQVEHKDDQNEALDDKKKMSLSKLKQDLAKKDKEEKEKLDKQDKQEDDNAKDGLNTKDVNKEKLDNISSLDKENTVTTDDQENDQDEDEEEEQGDIEEKKLTREDLDQMRQELEQFKLENNTDPEYSNELWKKYEHLTNDLSQDLCEQLRLILEPTLATKLQGDYKTGKRINMKKVIPYIASQFKKDKIWLRRTKPNKRQYQVLVAIDDTESMAIYHSGQFALEALTMISRAMSRLEVGQLGILRFGEDVSLVHSFDQVFSDQAGPDVITQFKFNQSKTNMVTFLSKTLQIMEMNKQQQSGDALQLVFIISDGWSLRDPETTRKHLREAATKNLFIVFIVIDNPVNNNSILDFESISFNNGKIQRTNYMSEFPFPYYVILRSLDNLPTILGDTLRQWFEMIKHVE